MRHGTPSISSAAPASSTAAWVDFVPAHPSRDPLDLALSEVTSPMTRAMAASSPHIQFAELIKDLPDWLRANINRVLFNKSSGLYCYMARNERVAMDRGVLATLAREASTGKTINTDHSIKAGSAYKSVLKLIKRLKEQSNPANKNHQLLIAYFEAQCRSLIIFLKKLHPSQQQILKTKCGIDLSTIPNADLSTEQERLINSLHPHYQQTPKYPTPRSVAAKNHLENLAAASVLSPARGFALYAGEELGVPAVPTLTAAPLTAFRSNQVIAGQATASGSAAATAQRLSSVFPDDDIAHLEPEAKRSKLGGDRDPVSSAIAASAQVGLELSFTKPAALARPFNSPLNFSASPGPCLKPGISSPLLFKPRSVARHTPSSRTASVVSVSATSTCITSPMSTCPATAEGLTGVKRKFSP